MSDEERPKNERLPSREKKNENSVELNQASRRAGSQVVAQALTQDGGISNREKQAEQPVKLEKYFANGEFIKGVVSGTIFKGIIISPNGIVQDGEWGKSGNNRVVRIDKTRKPTWRECWEKLEYLKRANGIIGVNTIKRADRDYDYQELWSSVDTLVYGIKLLNKNELMFLSQHGISILLNPNWSVTPWQTQGLGTHEGKPVIVIDYWESPGKISREIIEAIYKYIEQNPSAGLKIKQSRVQNESPVPVTEKQVEKMDPSRTKVGSPEWNAFVEKMAGHEIEQIFENMDIAVFIKTGVTVIEFNSPSCEPCKRLEPFLRLASARYGEIKFVSMNIDVAFSLSEKYKINATPTILIFKNGKLIKRIKDGVAAGVDEKYVGKDVFVNIGKSEENIYQTFKDL